MASLNPHEILKGVNYEILQGYKYRGLQQIGKVSRLQFKRMCNQIINDAVGLAETEEEKEFARLNAIRSLGERSLYFFVTFCLGLDWTDNDYGYRLCMDVQNHKWDRFWCIAREHYKSLIITCASTLWELLKNPNETFCIVSYNITQAQAFLGNIKKWCEEKELLKEVWSDVLWKDPQAGHYTQEDGKRVSWTWTQSALEFKRTRLSKEKSVEVSGIQGGLRTGGHFSRIIFDDAETPDTVTTAESINKAYEACVMATNIGQTNNLNMTFIGTFYAKDDLYVRLIKQGFFSEAVIQPCYDWNTKESILYTEEELEDKLMKMGMDAFVTQMLCDPSLSQASSFDSSWWRTWTPNNLHNLNVYFIVDPAGNKQHKSNDNSAIAVVGFDALDNMMVIDIIRDKLNAETKFTTLVSLYGIYRPICVYYEQESMQADIDLLMRRMNEINLRFPIVPYSMKKYGSKESRIKQLQAPLMAGKIYFCEKAVHRNWKGELEDMMLSTYREEYLGFPIVTHDDALDVLATSFLLHGSGVLHSPKNSLLGPRRYARLSEDDVYEVECQETPDFMTEYL